MTSKKTTKKVSKRKSFTGEYEPEELAYLQKWFDKWNMLRGDERKEDITNTADVIQVLNYAHDRLMDNQNNLRISIFHKHGMHKDGRRTVEEYLQEEIAKKQAKANAEKIALENKRNTLKRKMAEYEDRLKQLDDLEQSFIETQKAAEQALKDQLQKQRLASIDAIED